MCPSCAKAVHASQRLKRPLEACARCVHPVQSLSMLPQSYKDLWKPVQGVSILCKGCPCYPKATKTSKSLCKVCPSCAKAVHAYQRLQRPLEACARCVHASQGYKDLWKPLQGVSMLPKQGLVCDFDKWTIPSINICCPLYNTNKYIEKKGWVWVGGFRVFLLWYRDRGTSDVYVD